VNTWDVVAEPVGARLVGVTGTGVPGTVIEALAHVPSPVALMPATFQVRLVPAGSVTAGVVHVPPEEQPRAAVVYVVLVTPAM
jgi:hypothetical protein